MQHVTIGACALSARTYNAEVQGSDARLRNHFDLFIYYKHQLQRDKCRLILVYVLFNLLIVCIIAVPLTLFTAK